MKNLFVLIALLTLCATHGMAQTIPPYISNIDSQTLEGWWPMEGNATNQVTGVPATSIGGDLSLDRVGAANSAYDIIQPGENQSDNITAPLGGGNFVGSSQGCTINVWVQPNLDPDSSGVIAEFAEVQDDGLVINGWSIRLFGGDNLRGIYRVDAFNEVVLEATTDLYDSEILAGHSDWHMITFIVENSGARIYNDGQLIGSSSWSGSPGLPINAPSLKLGCSDASRDSLHYSGKIDDIAIWSRALTPAEVSTLFVQSPNAIAGCTNTNACNFLSSVTVDDATCVYQCVGCIDPAYCNYNDNATIAGFCDASCIVDTSTVVLFLDANGNGIFDNAETTIEGWPVRVTNESGDDTLFSLFSNAAGVVMATAATGGYRYRADYDETTWTATTIVDSLLTFPGADIVYFGFTPAIATSDVFWERVPSIWSRIDCVYGYGEGIYLQNTGGLALFGTIELNTDTLLFPGPDSLDTTQPDSSSIGFASWTNISIPPGERELFSFHANPLVDSLATGEDFIFSYHIQLFSEQGAVLDTTFEISKTAFCGIASDTVIAEPAGYYEPHYVLDGTRILYRIVFQFNEESRSLLGDTLEQAIVKQNLNTQLVDITTLDVLFSTTNAEVRCLHDDGTLDLIMPEANLLREANNPLQSFIILEFSVQLRDDLIHNNSLHQVFSLYGDASDDTATYSLSSERSYFHTIFDCNNILAPTDTLACINDTNIVLNAAQDFVDTFVWSANDNVISNFTIVEFDTPSFPSVISSTLAMTNPLCSVERDVNVYVYDEPFPGLYTPDGASLVADFAATYSWYLIQPDSLDDLLLENETNDTLVATPYGLGSYYCIMQIGHCEVTSDTVSTHINNPNGLGSLTVYPNPFSTQCTVVLPDRGYSVSLYDATGRIMRTWSSSERQLLLDRADLSSGIYILRAQKENNAFATRLIIE